MDTDTVYTREFSRPVCKGAPAHDCQEGACEGDDDYTGTCAYHRLCARSPDTFWTAVDMIDGGLDVHIGDATRLVFERFEHHEPASPMEWLVRFAGMIPRIRDALDSRRV